MSDHHQATASSANTAAGASRFGLNDIWAEGRSVQYLTRFGMVRHLTQQALRSFYVTPFASLLCLLTVSVSLFLLTVFLLCIENVRDVVSASGQDLSVSVYLKDSVPPKERDELERSIREFGQVESIQYISKTDALEEFRIALQDQAVLLEGLEQDNPLPASFEVRFEPGAANIATFETFSREFARLPGVEHVHFDRGLLGQLGSVARVFRTAGIVSVLLLLVITAFIMTNTIRLALYSRRAEIGIMRLVGATRSFVSAPCLIEGGVQGLLGGVIGLVFGYGAFSVARDLLRDMPVARDLFPELTFLSVGGQFLVVGAGILVCVVGSYVAVRRFSGE